MGGAYAGLEGPAVAMAQRDDYDLVMANTRRVQREARQGGVIVGRNAALILANRPAALHVKLDGPLAQRIQRAARDSGIGLERAAKRQKREGKWPSSTLSRGIAGVSVVGVSTASKPSSASAKARFIASRRRIVAR